MQITEFRDEIKKQCAQIVRIIMEIENTPKNSWYLINFYVLCNKIAQIRAIRILSKNGQIYIVKSSNWQFRWGLCNKIAR